MNTEANNEENTPTDRRPLGFWLRAVDGLLTREFAEGFASEGADRRDWMLLNAIAGEIENPWITARLERGGKRVRALAERGWIERTDDGWTLTDDGRAAKERLGAHADGIRSRVSGAVSPEDYATMTASLEAIARELGWDESRAGFGPRGYGRHGFGSGRGFGPGFGGGFGPRHGFDPRRGFGPGHGFGPGADGPCHPAHRGEHHRGEHHRGDGYGRGHRHDEHAYERGFDAGFQRGREGAASDSAA